MIVTQNQVYSLSAYAADSTFEPLLLSGNALDVLRAFPPVYFDCCMTSPPYWGQRQYHDGGIGLESEVGDYIAHLLAVFNEVKRVLKPEGSFWLNLGDTYVNKRLMGLPWRVALALMDEQGWVLCNSVIWNKIKGGLDNAPDRLSNVHEHVFHFTQIDKGYYYDMDAIRANPRKTSGQRCGGIGYWRDRRAL